MIGLRDEIKIIGHKKSTLPKKEKKVLKCKLIFESSFKALGGFKGKVSDQIKF